MTLTRNFGGRKFGRRLSALDRLKKQIQSTQGILADSSNGLIFNFTEMRISLKRMEKEAEVLSGRTQGVPHKVFTKKTGVNTGRKSF